MTEITRETLELASLGAGHRVSVGEIDGRPSVLLKDTAEPWCPHLDDGDAARLAVRLSMEINMDHGQVAATVGDWHDWARVKHDGTEPDKLRAWREAVTLCAAAVGERMRGER